MKKTVNVAIGGRSFVLDEESYLRLSAYLDSFKAKVTDTIGVNEVMDELEMRIADLFKEKLHGKEVVDIRIVDEVIAQLGLPEEEAGSPEIPKENKKSRWTLSRKFYRDSDDRVLCGVCSGLALYFNIDVVIVRVIFVFAVFAVSAGVWIYLILSLIAPVAKTAVEKCELRGLPATAENIRKFTNKNQ